MGTFIADGTLRHEPLKPGAMNQIVGQLLAGNSVRAALRAEATNSPASSTLMRLMRSFWLTTLITIDSMN